MVFEESGLIFTFSEAWNVHPFDDHKYYRWLSGLGFRGVDFIGVYQEKLVLMEVKNYRRREGMSDYDAFQKVREAPLEFAQKMVKKVKDSLEVVSAVNGSYRRKWWFPWYLRLPASWKRRSPKSYFWHIVSELADDPDSCIFVLWLDADSETKNVEEEIQKTLSLNLNGIVGTVIMAGQKEHPFGMDIGVRTIWKD